MYLTKICSESTYNQVLTTYVQSLISANPGLTLLVSVADPGGGGGGGWGLCPSPPLWIFLFLQKRSLLAKISIK